MTTRVPRPRRPDWSMPRESDAKLQPHIEQLRSTLRRLCDRPVSGALWEPALLALNTGLDLPSVELALEPGSRNHDGQQELVRWDVYDLLLRELQADSEDREVCTQAQGQLARHLHVRVAPPSDLAKVINEEDFVHALAALRTQSGMTLRAIASAMRDREPRHAWTKSGLEPYVAGKKLPPGDKRNQLENLLSVLCAAAGRPPVDVGHYLAAWWYIRSLPARNIDRTAPPVSQQLIAAGALSLTAGPVVSGKGARRALGPFAVGLAAALALLIIVVIVVLLV